MLIGRSNGGKTMMRYSRVPAIAIFLITVLLPGRTGAKAGPSAPFLYYYSDNRAAFIIERADGTDSRILSSYKLPATSDFIGGPGWSPSGQWFAWTASIGGGTGADENSIAYVVSRDGKQLFSYPDATGEVQSMEWSPTADLLMLQRQVPINLYAKEVYVVDIIRQKTILMLSESQLGVSFWDEEWSPDGQYIIVHYANSTRGFGYGMKVIPVAGANIEDRSLYVNDPGFWWPNWSKGDVVAYTDPTNQILTVENFNTKQIERLTAPGCIVYTDWNRDSKYAFVYTAHSDNACQKAPYQVWLLSVPDKTITLLSDQLDDAPNAPISTWSPTDDKGIYKAQGNLYLVTVSPLHTDRISALPNDISYTQNVIQWTSRGTRVVFVNQQTAQGSDIVAYNPSLKKTETIVHTDPQLPNIYHFSFSPDELFLVYTGYGDAYIFDVTSGKKVKVGFKSSVYPDNGVDNFIWHPTQHWFIMTYSQTWPAGVLGVASSDGSFMREVGGECNLYIPSCFGWVPELGTF